MFVTPESFPQVRQRATLLERDLLLCPPLGSQVHQVHTSAQKHQIQKENMFGPHTCLCFFPPPPSSPQLRMSFIVFSTDGTTLMELTEDRYEPPRCNFICSSVVFFISLTASIYHAEIGSGPGWSS